MWVNKRALEISRMFSVYIPIWDTTLIVSYGDDLRFLERSFKDQPEWSRKKKRHFRDQVRHIFKTEKNQAGALYMYHQDQMYHWIHMFQKDNLGTFLNNLSHEVLHMVFDLLRQRGLEHSQKSEESYTYLQGFLMEQIMEQMFPEDARELLKSKKKIDPSE